MFRRIRWRLTLWYSSVLAAALIIFGVVLYAGMQHTLMQPIDESLQHRAQTVIQNFLPFLPSACLGPTLVKGPDNGLERDSLFACYDAQGHWIGETRISSELAPHFSDPSLAFQALKYGTATDTIETHSSTFPTIRRYAVRVTDTQGTVLRVVQFGQSVDVQLQALDLLLKLLVLLGVLACLLASGGGLFLASRALLPARTAYKRQRDFIADASHELRTPLTMLRADAEVLLRDQDRLSSDDVAILQDMVMETKHMSSLANNMLDLARLDTNGAHMEPDVIDLSAVAVDIAHRMTALSRERDVAVRVESREPVRVIGDHLLLEQAALVLVDNAIKYNRPGGEVMIRTLMAGDRATLEVRDTGIGIAAEHLPRLGERFYRVDKARSREAGGAGLGLSIVQTIAARHGGIFRLTSQPGEGTTATLTLPAGRSVPDRVLQT